MADLYRPIHPSDLTLPRARFIKFVECYKPNFYREDARWLNVWEHYDKTHPMKDKDRRKVRREHYLGFYKKMCEELLK